MMICSQCRHFQGRVYCIHQRSFLRTTGAEGGDRGSSDEESEFESDGEFDETEDRTRSVLSSFLIFTSALISLNTTPKSRPFFVYILDLRMMLFRFWFKGNHSLDPNATLIVRC